MNFPLQIQFRNMVESDFIANAVWHHSEKLDKFCTRIKSLQVLVCAPHRHHHHGKIYHVQLRLHLKNGDLFVTTESEKDATHEDVYVAIRDAFAALKRRLTDRLQLRRGPNKGGALTRPRAKVLRLFADDGYGFIATPDNREIYFHENSVITHDFSKLKIGDEVRYTEEMGENGPQVTSMATV